MDTHCPVLLISHSSELSGGGEDDFERLANYLHGKYKLYGILPKGPRVKYLAKYFDDYLIVDANIFPFSRFSSFKSYISFFRVAKQINKKIEKFIVNKNIKCSYINSSVNFPIINVLHRYNIPVILSIKEVIKPNLFRYLIYRLIKEKVSDVIVISKYLKEKVAKYINTSKISIIYSSVEEDQILKNIHLIKNNIQKNNFSIVNIGAIAPYKGQHIILEALKNITESYITLNIIGRITDRKYYNKLVRKIKELSPNIQVNFKGEQTKSKTYEYILNSSFVVMSSFEVGMSLVIIETLLLNKFIIATKVGISEEVISDNENGYLFEPGDYNKLNENIIKFIDNHDTFINKNVNSTKYFYNNFNLKNNLFKINKLIIKNINN